MLKALSHIKEIADKGYLLEGTVGMNHTESQTEMMLGKAAFITNGTWMENEMQDAPREDGFEFAQKAINNLAQAGKRKDNLILKFKDIDQLGIGRIEVHAKHLSDNINSFSKIDIPVESIGKKDSQEFESLTAIVNSDSFVPKANSALVENEKLSQPQKVRNFVREKFQDLSQKIQDKTEAISESVYTIDGNSPISKWAFLSKIKDLFTKNQYQYTDKQKEEAKILAGMIENLPTLN